MHPLVHYDVAIDDIGNFGVDISTLVDATVRVPHRVIRRDFCAQAQRLLSVLGLSR